MRTIQTGRKCNVRCSSSGVDLDNREARPAPASGGTDPVVEPRSIFVLETGPVFFLISFTSGNPEFRRYEISEWQNTHAH